MKERGTQILRWIKQQWYKCQPISGMLMNHAIHGKFKVQYKDGAISQKFSYRTAKNYAEIFGGKVIDAF